MPNQLLIENAALPGLPNSYYSEEKSLSATGSAATLIPEIGWIMTEAGQDSDLTVKLKLTASPTYATLSGAGLGGTYWSDGTNLYINNASTTATAKYFVLAHKP